MSTQAENKTIQTGILLQKNIYVFGLFWLIAAILYFPTAKAGWVVDAIGWINDLKTHNFMDFINRVDSHSQSFYQLFAIHYYICYKLWGMNMWMWSLFYMTMHVVNATLLFIVCRNIFRDSGIQKGALIAFWGALLYVVCPHVSEVLVWKACFHYIMGVFFILFSLLMMQKYQNRQRSIYICSALFVFCLSAFGLEIFYIIPFLGFALALYYRFGPGFDKLIFRKTISWFFIPQILLFCLYFIGLDAFYKSIRPHGTDVHAPIVSYLSKPPEYIFHVVFFGRFFSNEIKRPVYDFCNSIIGLSVFYTLCSIAFLYAVFHFRKMTAAGKALLLVSAWVICSLVPAMAVSFPEDNIVSYDRYAYEPAAFIYMFLALLIYNIFSRKVATVTIVVYAAINIFFTVKVNKYWQQSSHIINNLVSTFPNDPSKIVLLLDFPSTMKGVEMIVARDDGAFKTIYNIERPDKINNPVYDVEAYYMQSPDDGAYVNMTNDSTIRVTLNHWGTWWLYYGYGATSYENKDYKVNMIDEGHLYELILKHPANQYLLLYEAGDKWKIVDQRKKNVDQL